MKNEKTTKIVITGLMAALCYVAFTFLKIPIPVPGGDTTALHIGNAFCVLAALILGGGYGGVAGSLGMTIADLLDPTYITSAPKTFILKLCIGLIAGFVAHNIAHITEDHDAKYVVKWSLIASIAGLGFNVIADPIVGYFYKNFILGVPSPAAKIMATWAAGATAVNAVVGTIVVVIVYSALRPALRKSGIFFVIGRKSEEKQGETVAE
ncbi:MAG: ECF transporter S component [Lachnospiraceae bacterium]